MESSETTPSQRPLLVWLGLLGLKTRRSAVFFMWLSIGLAVASLAFQFWPGVVLFFAAWWYWYAIRWVDKHGDWKS